VPETETVVRENTRSAIRKLLAEDSELIEDQTNERTVGCRLAQYLERIFEPRYKADADYNRHGSQVKTLEGRNISVDIVVHERHRDDRNILAVELKKAGKAEADDRSRLMNITDKTRSVPNEIYGYDQGLFLKFLHDSRRRIYARLSWFKNGVEDSAEDLYAVNPH